jgi:hypothetical protein
MREAAAREINRGLQVCSVGCDGRIRPVFEKINGKISGRIVRRLSAHALADAGYGFKLSRLVLTFHKFNARIEGRTFLSCRNITAVAGKKRHRRIGIRLSALPGANPRRFSSPLVSLITAGEPMDFSIS